MFNFMVASGALVVALGHAALGNVWWATIIGAGAMLNLGFAIYGQK